MAETSTGPSDVSHDIQMANFDLKTVAIKVSVQWSSMVFCHSAISLFAALLLFFSCLRSLTLE